MSGKTMKKPMLVAVVSLLAFSAGSYNHGGPENHAPKIPATLPYDVERIIAMPYEAPEEYRSLFEREAERHGVPAWILANVARVESSFRPNVVNRNKNKSKDYGIMQLNSRYLDEFAWRYNGGVDIDPFDPSVCVFVGAAHLSRLYRATGSWVVSVMAYNAGLSAVQGGGVSYNYVGKVMGYWYVEAWRNRRREAARHRVYEYR